jgi:beta-fructofuranosidase
MFIGDPGSWDDDMLWTMHVTPDPYRNGRWRMFYTGLCRKESGRIQRIGLAVSDDLYKWNKVSDEAWPLQISAPHYEANRKEGRHWVSFRDPYYLRVGEEGWLLAAARVPSGPVNRRGCVYLAKETKPGRFEQKPPLAASGLYDDIEVPALVPLSDRWYLIGSIREDIKVHYWYADQPEGPYGNFADNVLLPSGNYAARVCNEGEFLTVWNFFYLSSRIKGTGNMLPPPKELEVERDGQLRLRSYRGFDRTVTCKHKLGDLAPLRLFHDNPSVLHSQQGDSYRFGCETAFEIFLLRGIYRNFRMRGILEMEGNGKCGLVLRMDDNSDGYFISLDLIKGLIQIRAWGNNPGGGIERAFIYRPLQANYYVTGGVRSPSFELIAFGDYIELSVDGRVLLSLADDTYREGAVGFYTESAFLRVDELTLEELQEFQGEDWGGTDGKPQD